MALSRPQLDFSQARFMQYPAMSDHTCRLETFQDWIIPIKNFVDAGFYDIGTPKIPELCRCFYCGVEIYRWSWRIDPWKTHALHSPDCQYLIKEKGKESVEKAREQVRRFYYSPQKKKSGKKIRSEGRSRRNKRRRCQS